MREPTRESSVRRELKRLAAIWLVLLVLGALEVAASYLPLARVLRPLVMLPGIAMVIVVAVGFMDIGKGPVLVRAFAVAAMFWLLLLLGLGSVDPLTRTQYPVPQAADD